jgi:antitoxin (DNA-binding transcriptional repressor) of toxin-antitoxin stability system
LSIKHGESGRSRAAFDKDLETFSSVSEDALPSEDLPGKIMLPIRQSYASSNILAGLRLVSEGLKPLHLSPSTHIYQNWASACLPLPQHPVVECHVPETCESYGCMHSTFNLYTRNVYALGVAMTEPQQSNSRPPRQVGVREFRGNMTSFLRQAGHGASILITLHGQVIAEIRPPCNSGAIAPSTGRTSRQNQDRSRLQHAPSGYTRSHRRP